MPILDEYEAWCDAQVDQVVDELPIAKAIRYSRNHRAALRRFLDDVSPAKYEMQPETT